MKYLTVSLLLLSVMSSQLHASVSCIDLYRTSEEGVKAELRPGTIYKYLDLNGNSKNYETIGTMAKVGYIAGVTGVLASTFGRLFVTKEIDPYMKNGGQAVAWTGISLVATAGIWALIDSATKTQGQKDEEKIYASQKHLEDLSEHYQQILAILPENDVDQKNFDKFLSAVNEFQKLRNWNARRVLYSSIDESTAKRNLEEYFQSNCDSYSDLRSYRQLVVTAINGENWEQLDKYYFR